MRRGLAGREADSQQREGDHHAEVGTDRGAAGQRGGARAGAGDSANEEDEAGDPKADPEDGGHAAATIPNPARWRTRAALACALAARSASWSGPLASSTGHWLPLVGIGLTAIPIVGGANLLAGVLVESEPLGFDRAFHGMAQRFWRVSALSCW